jgi:uncharacterized protein YjhX (UPF0386 family)
MEYEKQAHNLPSTLAVQGKGDLQLEWKHDAQNNDLLHLVQKEVQRKEELVHLLQQEIQRIEHLLQKKTTIEQKDKEVEKVHIIECYDQKGLIINFCISRRFLKATVLRGVLSFRHPMQ